MMPYSLKVGISAVFDPQITPHARTFLRALALARNHIPDLGRVQFIFADDAADPETARDVARRFVDAGVDMVIGHFSSDAALAARFIYAEAGIPLLTPAATADAVTDGKGVYRLCPVDGVLAGRILALAKEQGWQRLRLHADNSAHGQAIATAIRRAAAAHNVDITHGDQVCAAIFAGRLAASAAHVALHVAACPTVPLVLTDDAISPHMPGQPNLRAPIIAVGFRPVESYPEATMVCRQYELMFGNAPETYFQESYAAFEVLAAVLRAPSDVTPMSLLDSGRFATVMGQLRFDRGDVQGVDHALWSLGEHGFVPWQGEQMPVVPPAPLRPDPSPVAERILS